jgi:hypothetical protein
MDDQVNFTLSDPLVMAIYNAETYVGEYQLMLIKKGALVGTFYSYIIILLISHIYYNDLSNYCTPEVCRYIKYKPFRLDQATIKGGM